MHYVQNQLFFCVVKYSGWLSPFIMDIPVIRLINLDFLSIGKKIRLFKVLYTSVIWAEHWVYYV